MNRETEAVITYLKSNGIAAGLSVEGIEELVTSLIDGNAYVRRHGIERGPELNQFAYDVGSHWRIDWQAVHDELNFRSLDPRNIRYTRTAGEVNGISYDTYSAYLGPCVGTCVTPVIPGHADHEYFEGLAKERLFTELRRQGWNV